MPVSLERLGASSAVGRDGIRVRRRYHAAGGEAHRREELEIDERSLPGEELLREQLADHRAQLEAVAAEAAAEVQAVDAGDGSEQRLQVGRAVVDARVAAAQHGVLLARKPRREPRGERGDV